MLDTVLHLYEFNPGEFTLQDDIAGYYVSSLVQIPVAEYEIKTPSGADRSGVLRSDLRIGCGRPPGRVKASTHNWSLCRMGYAQPW